ncbi:alanyl-tRNA editing protein [Ornithinibacillus xuwenensis]|uniref:DHHA1 domain-containing protein n=1 Tax=Ornithinibacillus xuwenensis TaxID=3144668 RepID=A0ABU9XGV9_9BACI
METDKLYYKNQYEVEFEAVVRKSEQDNAGHYVVLNQTAFYPTGGGQPYDTGTLNNIRVFNVEEVEGEIRHYVEMPIELNVKCIGEVDWNRRFDHMQQHTGQHILSAAFDNELGLKTVSFHLGKEICSIDLATDHVTEEELLKIEEIANQVILENYPIESKWVTEEELRNYSLRKSVSVSENIRLVIIPDFDYNGCGGTHPDSTGQVSTIKLLHSEKQKQLVRVFFISGKRVRKQLQEKHQVIQRLTALLSVPQEQMEEATSRILLQGKELEKTISDLKTKLTEYEANQLIEQGEQNNSNIMVKHIYQNRPISELQNLARMISQKTSNIVVLFINETDNKLQLVCARGNDLEMSMNQLVKQILPIINGRGGGSDTIAQGGGEKLIPTERLMEEMVSEILS